MKHFIHCNFYSSSKTSIVFKKDCDSIQDQELTAMLAAL